MNTDLEPLVIAINQHVCHSAAKRRNLLFLVQQNLKHYLKCSKDRPDLYYP